MNPNPAADSPTAPAGAAGAAPAVAELRDVSRRFGSTQALANVSLDVQPGEIHALLGRNGAGKSTAVAVLTGLERPDTGEVLFDGEPAPRDVAAWRDHVACLYQHSTLVPAMSVAENLFIDRFASGGGRGMISWSRMRRDARALLDQWQIDVRPDEAVEDLPFEQRQLVEIARALSKGSRFIILDEPTAQLDARQIRRLFASVQRIRESGVAFLYISHFLREVFEICDRATVMRDGRVIFTRPVADVTEDDLVRGMVGSDAALRQVQREIVSTPDSEPRVVVEGLGLSGVFAPFDLRIHPGEVVGIAGSIRSGATAIGEVLAGLRAPSEGTVAIDGTPVPAGRVDVAIRSGVGYVPQDRRAQGIVGPLGVAENLTMTVSDRLGPAGLISPVRQSREADELIDRYAIKVSHRSDPVDGLSGGNQQKVVVGRAVASRPRLLVMDTPTAGVDIASTATLFGAIDDAAREGLAVLVISNAISELRACDSVQVIFDGEMTRRFAAGWEESDMIAAMEGVEHS